MPRSEPTSGPLLFGDYSLKQVRGKWVALCYHCETTTEKDKKGDGRRWASAHVTTAHDITRVRQDVRQTEGWK